VNTGLYYLWFYWPSPGQYLFGQLRTGLRELLDSDLLVGGAILVLVAYVLSLLIVLVAMLVLSGGDRLESH